MTRSADSQDPSSSGAPTQPDRPNVVAALREIGRLLGLDGGNRFRAQAYERAARALEAVTGDLGALVRARRLTAIPGIGSSLARVVEELVETGRSALLERLRGQFPPGAAELAAVLSLRQIRALHESLGVAGVADLRDVCEAGRVRGVRGFGGATERRILDRLEALAAHAEAALLSQATRDAEVVRAHLAGHPSAGAVEVAGALRRRVEAVDRLDMLVATSDPEALLAHAEGLPAATGVRERTADQVAVERADGLETRVRVTSPATFGAAWMWTTGAPAHVAKLVERAAERGMVLDERGLRRAGRALAVRTEGALYEALGLPFIPPELREDAGELEAAANGSLPADLLQQGDVLGAVHCHTTASDGKHSVEQMARAAEALGLRYLTITDHSPTAGYAGGLSVERLRRQWDEIARVQERVTVRLLRGTESDILRDGSLDYPDAILAQLDIVIASIHSRYKMDAEQMTQRLVRALRHPVFKVWGHPLGRYVLTRPPFACDMERVLDAAAESRTAIEINGDPHRLDLEPRWLREARRRGIRFVVSSDAHSTNAVQNVRWGVDMARRGWVRRGEVLNTLEVDAFRAAVRP